MGSSISLSKRRNSLSISARRRRRKSTNSNELIEIESTLTLRQKEAILQETLHLIPPLITMIAEYSHSKSLVIAGGYDMNGNELMTCEKYVAELNRWIMQQCQTPKIELLHCDGYLYGLDRVSKSIDRISLRHANVNIDRNNGWEKVGDASINDHETICVASNKIYVFGALSDAKFFDPRTGVWTDILSRRNSGRYHYSLCVHNDGVEEKIFVTGGLSFTEWKTLDTCEIYDPKLDTFQEITPLIAKRRGHASTTWQNFVFVFGGQGEGNSPLSTFEVFNVKTKKWQSVAVPQCDNTLVVASNGDVIYLLEADHSKRSFLLNPKTLTLTQIADRNETRIGFGACVVNSL
jgi:hypothetical protein